MIWARGGVFWLGFQETKSNKSLNEMEGENRLGKSIDPGLLPWIQKGLQVLVAKMGDLVILSFTTIEEREWKPLVQPEVEDDYLYPSF
jgi:hypothetical protein